jgi:hypothetical protein
MRALCFALLLTVATPIGCLAQGAATSSIAEADIAALRPGQFIWEAAAAPAGPMVIVVNLTSQRAYVYRNGVEIGATTVSTGRPGHETPTGVFTILQKDKDHRSTIYNSAPMPYMERLTWDGVALHAGGLPGYPSSHGCVHLPLEFSKLLFDQTSDGMTVVVTKDGASPRALDEPGIIAPLAANGAGVVEAPPLDAGESYRWTPALSPTGPLTIVMSSADQQILVLRNGIEIGRARVSIPADRVTGAHALQFTGFDATGLSKWFYIGLPGEDAIKGKPLDYSGAQSVKMPKPFFAAVQSVLAPGATMLITDGSILGGGAGQKLTVLDGQ